MQVFLFVWLGIIACCMPGQRTVISCGPLLINREHMADVGNMSHLTGVFMQTIIPLWQTTWDHISLTADLLLRVLTVPSRPGPCSVEISVQYWAVVDQTLDCLHVPVRIETSVHLITCVNNQTSSLTSIDASNDKFMYVWCKQESTSVARQGLCMLIW